MHVNEIITQKIIDQLEKGVVPWHKPWAGSFPKNLVSKKEYRGINVVLLSMEGRGSPYWATYKQCQDLGGNVKKGSTGSVVCYFKSLEYLDENSKDGLKTVPLLRFYKVFNTDDCEGLESKIPPTMSRIITPIEECEKVVDGYTDRPPVHLSDHAAYAPRTDEVLMPLRESFESSEAYYQVLFHEYVHSTGHPNRNNRDGFDRDTLPRFGSPDYSKEELIAEIGSVFLYSRVGLESPFENSVAYIHGWMKKLKEEPNLVISAASKAQKAFEYVLKISGDKVREAAEKKEEVA
jgi:antirestriction protein ArdC